MPDIIQLLPDAVANQIAAGEVIQRPASAVKELLENAIDAGSTTIKLILKDAGKTLIQVVDDGMGMSDTDARMSFERHATSKIRSADDLFTLHTMGFRGEALASVAAIAQVELKTKRKEEETGTQLIIEGANVISQESCVCNSGTSIAVKNLFFNVPARRNFLKSNPVETRHIIEEFTRVALSNPQLALSMMHNEAMVFDLRPGNLRQRIAAIFGHSYNERLVPVEEETSIVRLEGFVGKPEFAKKVRGEQYFFVNNRFIKDGYLHHAVTAAFEGMITKDNFPTYFIFITINPASIDVNIHPTKTEIKFEDEKSVYAIMRAAVKRALGKFSIAPTLDFEQEHSFDLPLDKLNQQPKTPVIKVNPGYNPFNTTENVKQYTRQTWNPVIERTRVEQWHNLHKELEKNPLAAQTSALQSILITIDDVAESSIMQLHNQYILVNTPQAILIVDQQRAHERILYERFKASVNTNPVFSQQQLFPQPLEFTTDEAVLLSELLPDLQKMGFDITPFGNNTFVINGSPEDVQVGAEKKLLHEILEQYIHNKDEFHLESRENLTRSVAKQLAVKKGQPLSNKEMKELVKQLMKCDSPQRTWNGKSVLTQLTIDKILKLISE